MPNPAKLALRKRVLSDLCDLPVDALQLQSRQITTHLLRLPAVQSAQGLAVYLSMDTAEVQTFPLIEALLEMSKTVSVPVISRGANNEMYFVHYSHDSVLAKDKWGIPTIQNPTQRTDPRDLQVILAPGVAFSAQGQRLGRGKGYYDGFFTRTDAQRAALGLPPCVKIGLALSAQIVTELPTEPHDVCLDLIVTPTGVLSCAL